MAGDWIKVEHATVNKPEVLRLARLWGVTGDHALGVVVRFWVWLDNASVDGVVDGVSSHELDDMMRMNGFAQGMVAVGWLAIDEQAPRISVPRFANHNGETSKNRGLRNKRQAKWRENVDASVDGRVDAPLTQKRLPEKRREEKNINTHTPPSVTQETPQRKKRAAGRPLPADFAVSERVRKWAEQRGFVPESYLETFVGRHRANGKLYVDWDETFMNAIREDWYGIRASSAQPAPREFRNVV